MKIGAVFPKLLIITCWYWGCPAWDVVCTVMNWGEPLLATAVDVEEEEAPACMTWPPWANWKTYK